MCQLLFPVCDRLIQQASASKKQSATYGELALPCRKDRRPNQQARPGASDDIEDVCTRFYKLRFESFDHPFEFPE
jgi:hypothetical protein